MSEMIRDLCVEDQVYYWFCEGDQSTIVEWAVYLKEDIDEDKLKQAVASAMKNIGVFRSHPIIADGRVKARVVDEVTDVPVFAEDKKPRKLGTEETFGYLFYISFNRNSFAYREFHGLTDGMTIHRFLRTILMYYFKETKGISYDENDIPNLDYVSIMEKVLKEKTEESEVEIYDPEAHADEVFHFPMELFRLGDQKWRCYEIDLPIAPLLSIAKSYGSSVVPLLHAIIGNGIRKNYDVGDKTIVGYTAVDMRRIYDIQTMNNGSAAVGIPYRPMMDDLELGERAVLLRKELSAQITPGNIKKGLAKIIDGYLKADSQEYSIEQIVPALQWMEARRGISEPYTYGLSYIGKVHYSDEFDQYIKAVRGITIAKVVPFGIVASEMHGVLCLKITQMFESDELVKIICNELSSLIPEVELRDLGIIFYDRMDLKDLEHIDE